MAMETRRQRKLITISDENIKAGNVMGKLNISRNNGDIKRSILGDIAGNRMLNTTSVGLTNATAKYKSRLPVLKTGLTKNKLTATSKSTVSGIKENVPIEQKETKPSNVTSIIDKTKTLKLETQSEAERPAEVHDIDKEDCNNPFLVSAYTKDIYRYLRYLERTHPIKEDYLMGREITPKMRAVLIDWLVEVQQEYKLLQETLHITIGILDTYLQNKPDVQKQHMQLIGIAALFLAAKYEEITVPAVEDLVYISAASFKESDLYEMEREMFRTIGFDISRPISLNFLRRYSKAAYAQTNQHTFAKYFLELSLIEYSMCHIYPSLIAAAALYLALFVTSDKPSYDGNLWTKTLEYYSGYKFDDFKNILKKLAKSVINAKNSKLHQAVVQKYSSGKFYKTSLQPCLCSERMKYLAQVE